MHPPFEEAIVYIMTGSYVPWLPEGWPFLLLALVCFLGFLSADRGVKRIQQELREHEGRRALQEQRRGRGRR